MELTKIDAAFLSAYNSINSHQHARGYSAYSQNELLELFEPRDVLIAKMIDTEFSFNMEWFRFQLHDYINAHYSLEAFSPIRPANGLEYFWGTDCYNLLDIQISDISSNITDSTKIARLYNWRTFTMLYDHKMFMEKRIRYFIDKGYISATDISIDTFSEMARMARKLITVFLKLAYTQKLDIASRIKEDLTVLRSIEISALEKLQKLVK